MQPRILICEDEENIVSFLKTELTYEGFLVDAAFDGELGLAMFGGADYDLVLLDIMLPIKNGLECLREIRKTSDVPVIILTARKEVYDKVAFLNAGADDYVTKPFDTLELAARIKRHTERFRRNNTKADLPAAEKNSPDSRPPQHAALISVDRDGYTAKIQGSDISLTKTEFEILLYLTENTGKVKTRDDIIRAVFGDFYGESNVIDVNIKNIRAKIAKHTNTRIIETVRGKGYVIRGE